MMTIHIHTCSDSLQQTVRSVLINDPADHTEQHIIFPQKTVSVENGEA